MAKRIKGEPTDLSNITIKNCLGRAVILNRNTVYEPCGVDSRVVDHREYQSVNGHTFLVTHAEHFLPDPEPGVLLIVSSRTRAAAGRGRTDLITLYETNGLDEHGRIQAQGVQMFVPYNPPEDE